MKEKNTVIGSSNLLTRREFLKSSIMISAGLTFAGCSDALVSPTDTDPSHRQIIIVGAGLSGLVAAYELTKSGYDVVILEANSRIGGRVFTLHSPFLSEQFAEAGAARIPSDHKHTLNYANEFGLQLDQFYPKIRNYIRYTNGNRNIITNVNFLSQRPWPGSVVHGDYSKIRGGTDKLPKAFADYLGDKIILNAPVKIIDQSSDTVKVTTESCSEFTADRVIVTVPLTVLNKIQFTPQLSTEKQAAANGDYNYASSTRVYLQTNERFWQDENLNGWGTTDWPEEMWQPTFDQYGTGGILMNYASNRRADELDQLNSYARVDSLINRWDNIYSGIETDVERGTSHSWVQQEWTKGAYASPTSRQANRYDAHIGLPEGRIHFAGEHISNYHGWMQGALASGLRVVNEIVEAEVYI